MLLSQDIRMKLSFLWTTVSALFGPMFPKVTPLVWKRQVECWPMIAVNFFPALKSAGDKKGTFDFLSLAMKFSMALLQNKHLSHHTHTSMQADSCRKCNSKSLKQQRGTLTSFHSFFWRVQCMIMAMRLYQEIQLLSSALPFYWPQTIC